ncbi:hypothetical protein CHS0354_000207 [Potamilus streckersoni]|uniref:Uncharacterized protein n=1 Tax=Potamilus streckersoni TaxID=2493646 RepID=A0AAE0RQP5_9BIVA|nr:hypothetical protein CHS0354_000207 [Potamilus streckersoni]
MTTHNQDADFNSVQLATNLTTYFCGPVGDRLDDDTVTHPVDDADCDPEVRNIDSVDETEEQNKRASVSTKQSPIQNIAGSTTERFCQRPRRTT